MFEISRCKVLLSLWIFISYKYIEQEGKENNVPDTRPGNNSRISDYTKLLSLNFWPCIFTEYKEIQNRKLRRV